MIVWGKRSDGTRVSIHQAMRGVAEHLKCECGAELVARKGDENTHHFAHASGGAKGCHEAQSGALCQLAAAALAGDVALRLPLLQGRQLSTPIKSVQPQAFDDCSGICVTSGKGDVSRALAVVLTIKRRQPLPPSESFKEAGISAMAIDLASHRNSADDEIAEAIRVKANRCWLYNVRNPEAVNEPALARFLAGKSERFEWQRPRGIGAAKSRAAAIVHDEDWKNLPAAELRRKLFGSKYDR